MIPQKKPIVRIFDLESDGLLPYSVIPGSDKTVITKVHCIVVHDVDAGWYRKYGPDQIAKALADLAEADVLIAHNGIKYDLPVLAKLHGFYFPENKVLDTLVLSRLVYQNIKDKDAALLRANILPGKLYGSHSLKAWGYRLGLMKGTFGEQENAWEVFTPEMLDYCELDVKVTRALWDKLLTNTHYFAPGGNIEAIRLEHRVAFLMAQQERNGYPFDERGAARLYAELSGRRQALMEATVAAFGTWVAPRKGTEIFRHPRTGAPLTKYPAVIYPKTGDLYLRDGKTKSKSDYYKGAPYTPIEHITFNPGSRPHIFKVLQERGWVPSEFTDTGLPKVDEDSLLDALKFLKPEDQEAVRLVAEYLVVTKRISQIAEGDNGWLKMVNKGHIHGSVNPNGANGGRATHAFPNIAQVPSKKALYGPECRAFFGVSAFSDAMKRAWPEAVQVGSDASGLELRMLAHFMAPYDAGAYIHDVLDGDVHWTNVRSLGWASCDRIKDHEDHDGYRDNAKTFIYAFLYGAGDEKIGQIVGKGADEGKKLKKNFMAATPAIKALRDAIKDKLVKSSEWVDGKQKTIWKQNWMRGLDGRKLHVRSPHSALNLLLQSAGALVCKLWIVTMDDMLQAQGLKHGWDGDYALMAWVHDEVQIACRTPEIAEIVAKASQAAIRQAGEFFKFRCRLDSDSNIGKNWLDCH
ncbi:DNA polymerase I [Ralstonia phage RPSC1]|uniref:DNA polymerase n=1 Tax=Ralstonia phage RPSC1 TaxID=2041351 RepID=A0A2Z2U7X6_9CAUD|nr:DNA polymerase I [Ralstonia phage RPSC1]ATN92964.1 DNA polymerase-like protein [Ralstonia phage RPSC1]